MNLHSAEQSRVIPFMHPKLDSYNFLENKKEGQVLGLRSIYV